MIINIQKLQNDLKIKFKNKNLILEALTHKSANTKKNNEKLEFLGDRVIGLVLSKKLFDLYPDESEGVLDKRFASLVNKRTCCKIAWSIGVQKHIILGNRKKKIELTDEKILSDACEAVIGAIYIDLGFEFVEKYIVRIWKSYIDKSHITLLDPKTMLQEYSLKKYKKLPKYKTISSTGPKHQPTYKVSVSIIDSKQFIGSGVSKQQAQLDAAAKLIKSKKIG